MNDYTEIKFAPTSPVFQLPIEVKRLHADAVVPEYGSIGAAGLDLRARLDQPVTVYRGDKATLIGTGIAIHIKDPNFVGLIFARSGMGHKQGLVPGNCVGVIDADYQGELMVSAWNRNIAPAGNEPITINPGDRLAQLVIMPIAHARFTVVPEFDEASERGAGGFGSTGVA